MMVRCILPSLTHIHNSLDFRFAETAFPRCGSPIACLSALVNTSSANILKKPRRQRTEFTIDDAIVLLEYVLILLKVLPSNTSKEWSMKSFLELPKVGNKKLSW